MAADAAILQSLKPDHPPTLRFYRWLRPTLSLGYFQSLSDRSLHRHSNAIDVVRRATGGGAIVHDVELTYSLTVASSTRLPGAAGWLYEMVHQCVIEALASEGICASCYGADDTRSNKLEPFLCFQRRTIMDVVVGGYKVLGSAQRRGANGLLQHGSLLLAASRFAPQLPGLIELSGWSGQKGPTGNAGSPDHDQGTLVEALGSQRDALHGVLGSRLMYKIAERISLQMNWQWGDAELGESERTLAKQIEQERFGHSAWTGRR